MLLILFLNLIVAHLLEIFFWMLGAFLIGLYFGFNFKLKEKKTTFIHSKESEELNIVDDISKIRATKTFDRGGKVLPKSVPIDSHTRGLNFNRIGVATSKDKNNLQEINGIGKSIEQKLNNIEIFTFEQISNFNSKDIAKITDLIKFFPGRIERDDWAGQAFKLLNDKEE